MKIYSVLELRLWFSSLDLLLFFFSSMFRKYLCMDSSVISCVYSCSPYIISMHINLFFTDTSINLNNQWNFFSFMENRIEQLKVEITTPNSIIPVSFAILLKTEKSLPFSLSLSLSLSPYIFNPGPYCLRISCSAYFNI